MSLWNTFLDWLGSSSDMGETVNDDFGASSSDIHGCDINPASGLPMVGDCGGLDVAGNPYGTNLHSDSWSSPSSDFCDDSWSSSSLDSSSSWDGGTGSSWDD